MPVIVAMSSFVASGSVGLRAAHAVFEGSPHRLVSLPTVLLSAHLGHSGIARHDIPANAYATILEATKSHIGNEPIAGVITGYMPTAAHVMASAGLVASIKQQSPATIVLVDPIFGDDPGGLYIAPSVADAVRDRLIPLADIITPNRFELAWLTACPVSDVASAMAARRHLAVKTVVATSIAVGGHDGKAQRLATIAHCDGDHHDPIVIENAALDTHAHGTGDLFSALLLKQRLAGVPLPASIETAVSTIVDRLAATGAGLDIDLTGPLLGDGVSNRARRQ